MERISGPYRGYFIAAYSVQAGDGHVGYAKICVQEPRSVWSVTSVERLARAAGCRSELEAITAAERQARLAIAQLRPGWGTGSAPTTR